jgi:tetratricopeptide (TPR) repeat protein
MVRVTSAVVILAAWAAVTAGAVRPPSAPAPTATSVPRPNLLAEPFKLVVERADPQVAATPEWLRIYAGVVISDWATVRADAATLTARFPQSADAYLALAVGLEGLGDRAQAVVALQRAAELAPGRPGLWLMLARMYEDDGRVGDAAGALEKASRLQPRDLGVLISLADAYARSGNADWAAATFQQVTVLAPDNVVGWVGYLETASRCGRAPAAWAAYNQLRIGRPGVAAAVAVRLPRTLAAAVPTPIPPTPRPTPRDDAPRLVMAAGPSGDGAGSGSRHTGVWSQAALLFESKVVDIAKRAQPLKELVERYDLTCQGGAQARRSGQPSTEGDAKAPAAGIDWPTIWARSAAWTQAASDAPTSECRTLASDVLALADKTRSEVDKAVQNTAGTGLSQTETKRILQQYNLVW